MPATQLVSVDTLPCHEAPVDEDGHHFPHHPMPHLGALVCVYCHVPAEQIIKATPMLHRPWMCTCDSCYRAKAVLCGSCHLSFTVHPRGQR